MGRHQRRAWTGLLSAPAVCSVDRSSIPLVSRWMELAFSAPLCQSPISITGPPAPGKRTTAAGKAQRCQIFLSLVAASPRALVEMVKGDNGASSQEKGSRERGGRQGKEGK
nr:unnamed protein product [Digitaria exilis]